MLPLHPWFLIGLGSVLIPIILHMLLRAKPKSLVFPALRLIQNRRRQNVRRLRLRHVLLLLLRMGVLALLVLAVARPLAPPGSYAPSWSDWAKLAILASALGAVYVGVLQRWQRRRLPQHELTYRRAVLRGSTALLGLLVFGLWIAWPYQRRVVASVQQPALTPREHVPSAAVLLFDTSLSMEYQFQSHTRLEVAQDIARQFVQQLPAGSRVAIGDTSNDDPLRFQNDRASVQTRIGQLAIHAVSRTLDERLAAAFELQLEDIDRQGAGGGEPASKDGLLREVYVLTDLAASAWRLEESLRLSDQLRRMPDLAIYLVDVGVLEPTNVGLTGLTLSQQTAPAGGELVCRAIVEGDSTASGEYTVELSLDNEAGRLLKQGQATAKLEAGSATQVQFTVRGLQPPVRQGEVRLLSSDPLAFDQVRSFSVHVAPPPRVLLVSDTAAAAQFVREALAPEELTRLGRSRYQCQVISPGRLASEHLDKYAAVLLLNVATVPTPAWTKLLGYVEQGGGLGFVLGDHVRHADYLTPEALSVLPGRLTAAMNFRQDEALDLRRLDHPLLRRFAEWGVSDLTAVPIRRRWRIEPTADAQVLVPYTNSQADPAILERGHGKGTVLLVTTSFDRQGWNDLPAAGWSFVALMDQLVQYLSRSRQHDFNLLAGQDFVLPVGPEPPPPSLLLRKPGKQQIRIDSTPATTTVVLRGLDQLGNYRVLGAESKYELGFSVNSVPSESQVRRLEVHELDKVLGKDRYGIARSLEALNRVKGVRTRGFEVAPWLLAGLALLFVAELIVSNRFYDQAGPAAQNG